MNEKVLNTLEFHKIKEQLCDFASSELGRDKCLKLTPFNDINKIETFQAETADALNRILKKGNISFTAFRSVLTSVKRLEKGSILSTLELMQIAACLENTLRVKAYARRDNADTSVDSLDETFELLTPLTPLATEIRRCILAEDEISDDASSELRSIRRSMKSINDKIHTQLTQMVNGSLKTYLQDSVITMRDGRYCIPVKAEHKTSVPGMVHDTSSSASTYFIEPAAIVNLNNELRQLEIREEKEIQVILSDLSNACSEHLSEIKENVLLLSRLDFIFARASLALSMNAVKPVYNDNGYVNIRGARHPLLNKSTVVPIDIRLGRDYDLLIITGPNTGGKTVALKTLGLLCLMGQSGLHIPAKDNSELCIFSEVFADIGDEQSIEQSLSTFSSHMKRIVEILDKADYKSLCLFDELGAGTDPTEGAALAIAILSHLHKRQIRTLATTHYSELKIYALKEKGVENACCEFDVDTLRPTYRLLIGVPGKSNAFAISEKLGLPSYIIDDAKKSIDKKDEDFEDVMIELEGNRILIEQEKAEADRLKSEIAKLKDEYETKQNKLNESRDKIIREANEKARQILKEAKESADEAILLFQKSGSSSVDIRTMEKQREKLRKQMDKTGSKGLASSVSPAKEYKPSDFKLGEDVRILSMGLEGTVSSVPDSKGNLFVQCGIMRMQTNIKDLDFVVGKSNNSYKGMVSSGHSGKALSKSSSISSEINLLGLTVDEALSKLDKYLDDAYLSHLKSVRVVHGKGTGALRNAVHKYLKKVSYVSSFNLAEYGEGDAGVTIVSFK